MMFPSAFKILYKKPRIRAILIRNHCSKFEVMCVCQDLNAPLEHFDAGFRYALDETRMMLDSPMLMVYTTTHSIPLAHDRESMWTLMPVLGGDGRMIADTLLQSCKSIPVDDTKCSAVHDLCISATENAQQSEQSWMEFAKIWLLLSNY